MVVTEIVGKFLHIESTTNDEVSKIRDLTATTKLQVTFFQHDR